MFSPSPLASQVVVTFCSEFSEKESLRPYEKWECSESQISKTLSMEIKSTEMTQVIGPVSQSLFDTLAVGGETGGRVTVGRAVEELDVEEGVVSAGHPVPVRRQHDAADGVAARTHDHHCGEEQTDA